MPCYPFQPFLALSVRNGINLLSLTTIQDFVSLVSIGDDGGFMSVESILVAE